MIRSPRMISWRTTSAEEVLAWCGLPGHCVRAAPRCPQGSRSKLPHLTCAADALVAGRAHMHMCVPYAPTVVFPRHITRTALDAGTL